MMMGIPPESGSFDQTTIRPFHIDDYDAVVALWRLTGLPFKPLGRDRRNRIEIEIKGRQCIFLVAEFKGQIIGTILANHEGRKGWINRLAVHPDHQRRGLAGHLLSAAENRLAEAGIEIIACLIEQESASSMTFFEQAGYTRHPDIFYFTKKKSPHT
jgi:ribosomal protein S18 acetylase RimI-like enzyme